MGGDGGGVERKNRKYIFSLNFLGLTIIDLVFNYPHFSADLAACGCKVAGK